MKRWWQIFVALGLLVLSASLLPLPAEAGDTANVNVNPERFLRMSFGDQILYTDGVLDALTALAVEGLIPKDRALCPRSTNYGEFISGVNSYLYKALGSEEPDVKGAVKITPVSVWIVRQYWQKCSGEAR